MRAARIGPARAPLSGGSACVGFTYRSGPSAMHALCTIHRTQRFDRGWQCVAATVTLCRAHCSRAWGAHVQVQVGRAQRTRVNRLWGERLQRLSWRSMCCVGWLAIVHQYICTVRVCRTGRDIIMQLCIHCAHTHKHTQYVLNTQYTHAHMHANFWSTQRNTYAVVCSLATTSRQATVL